MPFMKPTRVLFCSCAAALIAAPALAALGGGASSVEADSAHMKGTVRVSPQANFTVHEIETSAGIVVHEYLSLEGKVFAVSWRGPGIPDLRQLLGSYYGSFEQAASTTAHNHHNLAVETPDVVVQSSGHTRAFSGRAWAPALLPQNFSLNDIN
jgi:Protein of unknown function (DUF2844)